MRSLRQSIASEDNNYNLLRLIFAAAVIYYHSDLLSQNSGVYNPIGVFLGARKTNLGEFSVACFFFLSGIFVSQSYARDGKLINFTIRRAFRIFPGLMVCLLVTSLLGCVISQGLQGLSLLTSYEYWEYVYLNTILKLKWNIAGVFEGRASSAINGSIHTLPTEVKMYCYLGLAGFLVPLKKRLNGMLVSTLFILFVYFRFDSFIRLIWMPDHAQILVFCFFGGVFVYAISDKLYPAWWWLPLLALAILTTADQAGVLVLYLASMLSLLALGQLPGIWRPKSDLSYGIYIYGWPSQQILESYFHTSSVLVHSGLALAIATGFASLSWRWIEKPAIRMGRDLISYLPKIRPPLAVFRKSVG